MKALTFEEFDMMVDDHVTYSSKDLFNAARQGMVPEDECVRLPLPNDWPEWAAGVRLVFEEGGGWGTPSLGGVNAVSTTSQKIRTVSGRYVERPAPAWTPKDWEPVIFAKPEDRTTLLGVYHGGEIHYGGLYYTFQGMRCAKLDLSRLGKPWEEIPNA